MIYEFQKNEYTISTDKAKLQFDVIHGFLSTSYWSPNIPMEIVKSAAQNSLAFGIYKDKIQVGYARIISDYATFAYLADVFVLESERGKGLSKWLMECIIQVPDLQGLRRWMLATRDAHGLYAQFGFTPLDNPAVMMQIARPNIYTERQPNEM
ncbi:GNAT family N-acetyltransferase [Emticicia sp. SJ17W-69]|uniref:GNAT family N-acetyltransferase n=1 Tax=Emticicia sp. SJ17W-69 TaxID=3421657 RepID=UPI003EBEC798